MQPINPTRIAAAFDHEDWASPQTDLPNQIQYKTFTSFAAVWALSLAPLPSLPVPDDGNVSDRIPGVVNPDEQQQKRGPSDHE